MSEEQRIAPRFKHRAPVGYAGGAVQGRGFTVDLSISGARVADVSGSVVNGTRVQLVFGILDAALTLPSEVVRQTAGGFAVRFLETSLPESLLRTLPLPPSGEQD